MARNIVATWATQSSDLPAAGAGKEILYPYDDGSSGRQWRVRDSSEIIIGILKHNYAGTAAPTTGDDVGDGYGVGSIWVDTTNDNAYICEDNSLGAAVWAQIDGTAGGSSSMPAENTSIQTIDRIPRIGGTHDAFEIFTAWRDAADASNPVIPTGATSTSDDKIREIGNVLYEPWDPERPYKMFYTGYDAGESTDEKIHYAYSKNGTDWTKFASNPVISARAEDPYVLYKDGTYYMYVEDKANQGANGNIRRYSSTDCETWSDDGQITLNTDDEQSPTVWIEGDTWYMLYEQYPATPNDIRLATSSDGLTWTNSGSNPVFSPGDVSWDTVDDVVPDDLLLIDGTYYMSYHSAGPTNGIYKSGIATSTDLINWTDLNGAWTYTGWADGQTHLQFCFDGHLRFYVIKSLDFTTGIYEVEMDVPIVAIASDAITASSDYILLQAETGSTDNLATINGGKIGQSLVLKAASGETITLKHATDNIHLNGGADFELSGNVAIRLFKDGAIWTDLSAGGSGSGVDTTGASAGDDVIADGAGGTDVRKNNLSATAAPTANDDSGDGYEVASRWIDTTNDKEYVCLDATSAAAVWTETTQSGSGGGGTFSKTLVTRRTETVLWDLTLGSTGNFDTNNTPDNGSASPTFSGYDALRVELVGRSDDLSPSDIAVLYFNNDTTDTNYRFKNSAGGEADRPQLALVTGDNSEGNAFSGVTADILGADDTNVRTTVFSNGVQRREAADQEGFFHAFDWENTAAVSRIQVQVQNGTGFMTNSRLIVTGIKEETLVSDVTSGAMETSDDDVSNPPTDAELDTAFGTPATVGNGFLGLLDDGGLDTNVYLIASNGTSWWYTAMTKAT